MANRFDLLWERTQREIPGAEIVLRKNSLLLKVVFGALHWLLRIVTLGRVKSDYSGFATTVCRTIYMPDDFPWWSDYQRYSRLRHELVHLRQFRTWPMPFLGCRGLWLINAAIMGLCYLLVLPVLLTFRAKFEKEGYRESILVRWECGGLREAVRMIHVAHGLGMQVMLGCMVETSLSLTAAAHLSPLVEQADLDSHLLLRDDPFDGLKVREGRIILPSGAGLGVHETDQT